MHFCARCFNYAEGDLCEICASAKRDDSVICVVSEPRDIPPIERTAVFNGVYHVLGGVLAPMEGVGPGDLRIAELMARLGREDVTEVVLAMNPNIEGETTAAYLARLIKPLGVKVTRPASGLPVGGDLEFADEVTLGRALDGRLPLLAFRLRKKKGRCEKHLATALLYGLKKPGYLQQAGTSCLTRSCSSARLASLKRSSVPTR